jgi:hypothetical protein
MQTDTRIEPQRQDQPAPITTLEIDSNNLGCTVHPKSIDDCIRVGQEAWKRLSAGHAWSDWVLVGEALLAGRVEAMRVAHTNRPEGRRYNEEYGDWLKATGFDVIESTARKRLFKCLEHRTEIQTWRTTLTTNKLLELNHPGVVLRRWEKACKKPDKTTPKRVSHVEKLNASLIQLEEENTRLKREVENGSPFTRADTARDIAGVVFRIISPSKAREVARELNRLARSIERQRQEAPQGAAEVQA